MTTTNYMPRAESLADKVCRFFMRLPDEELMSREIAEKWGIETKNVGSNLMCAVAAEYLAVDGTIYSAGSCIALFKAGLAHQPAAAGGETVAELLPGDSAAARPMKKRNGPFWIDPKTVLIEPNVPMPGRRTAIDWSPLLDVLTVGDSFLLPPAAKSAINAAMKAYKDATGKVLASRRVQDGIRVWRLE